MPPKDLFGRPKKQPSFVLPENFRAAGVFYIRVSSTSHEHSLEVQRETILNFAETEKIYQLGDFFIETSSGRTELQKAFKVAKENDAYIVTSTLDRLSRNPVFINDLIMKNIKFVSQEHGFDSQPQILRLITAMKQNERERISVKTKEAMAMIRKRYEEEYEKELRENPANAKKKRLGIPDVSKAPTHISHIRKQEALNDARQCWEEFIKPTIDELYSETYRKPTRSQIADRMNSKGLKNKYENEWTPSILYHMISKLKRSGEYEDYNPAKVVDESDDDN
jgi:hypothetical protein